MTYLGSILQALQEGGNILGAAYDDVIILYKKIATNYR
jgi:hypothetical protein